MAVAAAADQGVGVEDGVVERLARHVDQDQAHRAARGHHVLAGPLVVDRLHLGEEREASTLGGAERRLHPGGRRDAAQVRDHRVIAEPLDQRRQRVGDDRLLVSHDDDGGPRCRGDGRAGPAGGGWRIDACARGGGRGGPRAGEERRQVGGDLPGELVDLGQAPRLAGHLPEGLAAARIAQPRLEHHAAARGGDDAAVDDPGDPARQRAGPGHRLDRVACLAQVAGQDAGDRRAVHGESLLARGERQDPDGPFIGARRRDREEEEQRDQEAPHRPTLPRPDRVRAC